MFIFRIYDVDADNEISTLDLIELLKGIPAGTPLYQELLKLNDQIIQG